jgi:autotransporter-associated beta strand protein/T5SS/PEP-CTERM-associated repeat protein
MISENFDDITTLAGKGWHLQNASSPVGITNWFQGTNIAATGPFDSHMGAANSYIGANYNNTASTGTISNWLATPAMTIANGDVLTFYTRKASSDDYADRLEVRISTNGTSTNVGSGGSVGDFTTLLLSVNPTLALGVYPTTWTQYTVTVSGLTEPIQGRLAFRYYVTNGGSSGANSDYIGIDTVAYLATRYWNGSTTIGNGTVHGGNGIWDTTSTNWTDPTGILDDAWTGGQAVFQGTAGTVNIVETVAFRALDFTTDGYVIEGAGELATSDNGRINVAEGLQATIGAVISGTGALTKTGAGELTLTGANTYSGGTSVQEGVLRQESGAFVDNTSYLIDGGTLDLNGDDLTMSSLSGTGGIVQLGGMTLTVDQSTNSTYAGALMGSGYFTKTGAGTLTLTGVSTIDGYLTAGGGTLAVAGGATVLNIVNAGGVLVGSGADANIVVSDGAKLTSRDADIGLGAVGNVFVTGAGSRWDANYISVGRITQGYLNVLDGGVVSNQRGYVGSLFAPGAALVDGVGSLWDNSAGLLVGFGAGSDGLLTINNGGVVQASQIEMGNGGGSGAIVLTGSAVDGRGTLETGAIIKQGGIATIDVDGGLIRTTVDATSFLSGFGAGDVTLGTGGLFVDSNGHDIGFTSPLDGAGGLTKQGAGTLTLGAANTYAGGTVITEGGVLLGSNSALGTGVVEMADGTRIGSSSGNRTLANHFSINGDVTFVPVSLGTITLNGNVDINGAGRTLTVSSAVLTEVVFGGVVSNDGGNGINLQSSGGGVGFVTFSGASANTYTGATVVGANVSVTLKKTGGATAIAGDLEIQTNGKVTLDGDEQIANTARVDVEGTGIFQLGSGTGRDETIGSLYGDGVVRLNAGSSSATLMVGEGDFSGTLTDGTATSGGLVKIGTGTLVLSGANSYGGSLSLQGGVLVVGSNANIGSGNITFEGGALLADGTFSTNRVINVGTGGGRIMAATGETFTLTRPTFNEMLGSQSLNFGSSVHTGTVVVTGNSLASGAAGLDGGRLVVNGSLASSSFSVASGATLGGTGSLTGAVTVADGGRLTPGASPGTLTVGSLLLNDASLLDYELGSPSGVAGVDSDLISVVGNLTLDGVLNLLTASDFGTGTYQLFGYGGSLVDNALVFGLAPAGYNLEIDFSTPNQVNLVANYTGLQFWDGADTSPDGIVDGGNGVWDASATNWTNETGSANTAWSDLTAVFSGPTGGTVDVVADVTVAGLQFATDGYLLADAGGSIEFTNAATEVRVDSTLTADIAAEITGAGGLMKTGGGRLVLGGTNTYAGDTAINAGVLEVSADENLGANSGAIVFNGGTLFTAASFSSARELSVAAGGFVETASATTFTHTGLLTGSGSLVKTGDGTLEFTGDNATGFDGQLHVDDGLVSLAAGGRLSAAGIGVGVADGSEAELVVTGGGSSLVASDFFIVGSGTGAAGSLTIENGGVVSLGSGVALVVGANDASGTLTLAGGGTLEVGGAGGLSASATAVSSQINLAGGTLRVVDADLTSDVDLTLVTATDSTVDTDGLDATLSGVISGDGALTKAGAGTLSITGANTYTGGTTISAGTLAVDSNSLPGDVTNEAELLFNQSGDGTYAGVVSGAGTFTKTGAGTLILSGASTYTGSTFVDGGALLVNGGLATTTVTVSSGALLGGSGSIGGGVTVMDGGFLSPGNGVGILTLGSLTLQFGSTTRMEINGVGAAGVDYDHIRVNSTATLGGTLELIPGAYVPQNGDQFVLIDADAIALGSDFAAVNGLGNALIFSSTITDDYTLTITAVQTGYAAFALTENQRAVATNLDSDWDNPALGDVVQTLNGLPGALLPSAFDLIAPEEYALLPNVARQTTRAQWAALRRRLGEVRAGSVGWSTSGLGHTDRTAPLLAAVGDTGDALAFEALAKAEAADTEPRRGFFVSGEGAFGEADSSENPGFDFTSGSFLVGADANLLPDLAMGVAAGYDTTSTDPDNGGSIQTDTARLALYGTWTSVEGAWFNATAGAAYHWHDAKRDALGGTASSSPETLEFNSLVETGVNFVRGVWTVTPSVGLDYVRLRTDDFVESGSLAPLSVEAQTSDSLRSELALTISRRFSRETSVWDGWVRAGWAHEFLDTKDTVNSQLASGAGGLFSVDGNRVQRDSVVFAAGVRAALGEATFVSIGYSGDYNVDYRVHSLSASLRLGF